MFIQIIEGRTERPEERYERRGIWQRDLMPSAIGYLGSTGGCTSSGDCILVARFESRAAAQRNSDRPEQGKWWAETQKCFDGSLRIHDTDDVQSMTHGELDSAPLVQVMEGHVSDRRRLGELGRESDLILAELRPDLLGSVTAYFRDDELADMAISSRGRCSSGRTGRDAQGNGFEVRRMGAVDEGRDLPTPPLALATSIGHTN